MIVVNYTHLLCTYYNNVILVSKLFRHMWLIILTVMSSTLHCDDMAMIPHCMFSSVHDHLLCQLFGLYRNYNYITVIVDCLHISCIFLNCFHKGILVFMLEQTQNKITMLNLYCQSLSAKFDNLKQFLADTDTHSKITCITLQEK